MGSGTVLAVAGIAVPVTATRLSGEAVDWYVDEWTVTINDITSAVARIRDLLKAARPPDGGSPGAARTHLPAARSARCKMVATITDMADPPSKLLAALEARFGELEEAADRYARAYARWRYRYEWLHFLLGIPATVLAGVAGATAFAQRMPGSVVGTCAAIAAALAGVQTIVRPDRRARFNHTQQFTLARLAMQAANYRQLTLPSVSFDEARARLDNLYDEFHAALGRSPD